MLRTYIVFATRFHFVVDGSFRCCHFVVPGVGYWRTFYFEALTSESQFREWRSIVAAHRRNGELTDEQSGSLKKLSKRWLHLSHVFLHYHFTND